MVTTQEVIEKNNEFLARELNEDEVKAVDEIEAYIDKVIREMQIRNGIINMENALTISISGSLFSEEEHLQVKQMDMIKNRYEKGGWVAYFNRTDLYLVAEDEKSKL